MNSMATTTLLTWEQFERLPDEPGKQELLNGELIKLPPAKSRHHKSSEWIYGRVKTALRKAHARGEASALGAAHIEIGYRLGTKSWLQPDVSIEHAGQTERDYLEGSPAIAIEIVSPGNTPRALAIKTKLYFEFGALEVWHVYADEGYVIVHVANADPVAVRDFLTTSLLPGFTLNLQDLVKE
jgi:Uma2 family endonuclease